MVRTQIQIPDKLYGELKRICSERELSLAEIARRGLEYMVKVCPPVGDAGTPKWELPLPINLGGSPLVPEEYWRELANESLAVSEKKSSYRGKK